MLVTGLWLLAPQVSIPGTGRAPAATHHGARAMHLPFRIDLTRSVAYVAQDYVSVYLGLVTFALCVLTRRRKRKAS